METQLMSKTEFDNVLSTNLNTTQTRNVNEFVSNNSLGLYYDHYQTYHHYYPTLCWPPEKNTFEQAFKVTQRLLDKKLIKLTTVKQFMDTISEIQQVL